MSALASGSVYSVPGSGPDSDCFERMNVLGPWVGEHVRPGRGPGCASPRLGAGVLPWAAGADSPVVGLIDFDADSSLVWDSSEGEKFCPMVGRRWVPGLEYPCAC